MIKNKLDNFPLRHWAVYVCCLPADILCWLIVLLLWVLSGDKLVIQNGLWTTIPSKSWLGRSIFKKYGGGTLGHGGWLKADMVGDKGIDTRLERHEHKHVEQFETTLVFLLFGSILLWNGYLFGILWQLAIGLLVGGWWLYIATGWFVAWLRGESLYRGSVQEESAYDSDDLPT